MLNILVVDDSLAIRIKMKNFLKKLGHSIAGEAKDGEEAIELYKELTPDLITMDISMPVMNGVDSLKEIMKISSLGANIIMITANGQDGIVKEALLAGAKGYILKPVSEEKLQDSIGRIFSEYFCEDRNVLEECDLGNTFG